MGYDVSTHMFNVSMLKDDVVSKLVDCLSITSPKMD